MIQKARSSSSQSLFRELETAILLINNVDTEKFFINKMKDVFDKRRDPEATLTGAKNLRTTLLAYLEQRGEVKTANVWCRKLKFHQADELLNNIREALSEQKMQGVVELHLQDREINSPHIQFVGNSAEKAEELIANEVLKMDFEDNFESAVSRKAAPSYLADKSITIKKYDDIKEQEKQIETQEQEIKERREFLKEHINSLHKKRDEFLSILGIKKDSAIDRVSSVADILRSEYVNRREKLLNNNTDELLAAWQQKARHRR